jgi:hypothetical protein
LNTITAISVIERMLEKFPFHADEQDALQAALIALQEKSVELEKLNGMDERKTR